AVGAFVHPNARIELVAMSPLLVDRGRVPLLSGERQPEMIVQIAAFGQIVEQRVKLLPGGGLLDGFKLRVERRGDGQAMKKTEAQSRAEDHRKIVPSSGGTSPRLASSSVQNGPRRVCRQKDD